jgi:oxygen-independent coproporphyrinogen-3 oxidase
MAIDPIDKLGLYLSIPFCRSKCTYCNFASGVFPASDHARYVERLIEDLVDAPAQAEKAEVELPRTVDTVYLGGGTPSLLAPVLIAQIFGAIRNVFVLENNAEITVECAPGQLADATLEALVQAGVNRVSLGVQSFIDRETQVSGRLHNRAVALDDVRRVRAAGITNVNIDLIAGLAGQTNESWQESVAVLIDAGAPHASVYMLEVDDDSRLGRELLSGGSRYHAELVPNDDAIARMYETAIERLSDVGLEQYEISNFARRGLQSRHNLRYWERRPYLGIGLDAASALRAKESVSESVSGEYPGRYVLRSTTTDELKAYLEGPQPAEIGWLSPERQQDEAWFLGLRLNSGVELAALRREFGNDGVSNAIQAVKQLVDDRLLVSDGETVRLTAQGRLLSNEVFQQFLGIAAARPAADEPAVL